MNWNPNSVATVHIITLQTTTMTTSTRTTTDSTLFHFLFRFPSLRRPPGRTDGQHALLTQQSPTHTFLDGRHTFIKEKTITVRRIWKKKSESGKGNQRRKPSLTRTSTQQPCQHKKRKRQLYLGEKRNHMYIYERQWTNTLDTMLRRSANSQFTHIIL